MVLGHTVPVILNVIHRLIWDSGSNCGVSDNYSSMARLVIDGDTLGSLLVTRTEPRSSMNVNSHPSLI
jgi:hypothetical protein